MLIESVLLTLINLKLAVSHQIKVLSLSYSQVLAITIL